MATISKSISGSTHLSPFNVVTIPYVIENQIDLAAVAASKGSDLAVGDIIEALHIPAGTQVLFAGFQVVTETTGSATDVTVSLGITGVDDDQWVAAFDLDGAAAGAYATVASTAVSPTRFLASADTIDLVIASQTGTLTGGKLRVYAVVVDLSNKNKKASAGIVQVGS